MADSLGKSRMISRKHYSNLSVQLRKGSGITNHSSLGLEKAWVKGAAAGCCAANLFIWHFYSSSYSISRLLKNPSVKGRFTSHHQQKGKGKLTCNFAEFEKDEERRHTWIIEVRMSVLDATSHSSAVFWGNQGWPVPRVSRWVQLHWQQFSSQTLPSWLHSVWPYLTGLRHRELGFKGLQT